MLLQKLSALYPVVFLYICHFQPNSLRVHLVYLTQNIFKICLIKTRGILIRGTLLIWLFLTVVYDIIAVTQSEFYYGYLRSSEGDDLVETVD